MTIDEIPVEIIEALKKSFLGPGDVKHTSIQTWNHCVFDDQYFALPTSVHNDDDEYLIKATYNAKEIFSCLSKMPLPDKGDHPPLAKTTILVKEKPEEMAFILVRKDFASMDDSFIIIVW